MSKKHKLVQIPLSDEAGDGAWHLDENPISPEYTLCGLAPEGVGISNDEPTYKQATIKEVTCSGCLALIKFCKEIK